MVEPVRERVVVEEDSMVVECGGANSTLGK